MDKNILLTKCEVAEKLRISIDTVNKYARQGKIKSISINSRGDRRYRPEDIEEFLNNNKNNRTGGGKHE